MPVSLSNLVNSYQLLVIIVNQVQILSSVIIFTKRSTDLACFNAHPKILPVQVFKIIHL